MSEMTKERPKHLALHEIRLPLAGFASILHRVSGAGLFLMLPFLIYLLSLTLDPSPSAAARLAALGAHPLVKLLLFGLSWAYLHHFCAGIRFLLIDIHIGVEKDAARKSATGVLIVSLLLTAVMAAKIFGGI